MKTQHIVGTLFPDDEVIITTENRHAIHAALVATGLVGVISADRCQWDNAMAINHTSLAEHGNHSPLEFIKQLNSVLWRVNAAGLKLNGEVTITVTGNDPVIYRVVVTDSELGYKRANLGWSPELSAV